MSEKQQLRFALVALVAGLAWGFVRHRNDAHRSTFAVFQGLEWFITYGGAVALIAMIRETMQRESDAAADRDGLHFLRREVTEERTGALG
jgi:hypothetical protein